MRRLLSHTADLRAELSATSFETLCAEAVDLVRELVVGTSPVERRESRRLALAGDGESERFFRFVRELVYLVDAERFLPASCAASGDGFIVSGERFDPTRHVAERQIKALTRHHYSFAHTPEALHAELIFDL